MSITYSKIIEIEEIFYIFFNIHMKKCTYAMSQFIYQYFECMKNDVIELLHAKQNFCSIIFIKKRVMCILPIWNYDNLFCGKVEVTCFEIPNGIYVACIKRKTELGALKLIK